eukprot:5441766-Amphidinium_carterae.1
MAIAKIRAIVPKAIDVRLQRANVRGIVWTDNKGLHDTIQKDGEHGKLEKRAALDVTREDTVRNCRDCCKAAESAFAFQRMCLKNELKRGQLKVSTRPKRSGATLASAANAEMDE